MSRSAGQLTIAAGGGRGSPRSAFGGATMEGMGLVATGTQRGLRPVILLTGATGCIGGRLAAALEARGHALRCMTRRPAALAGRLGLGNEAVYGDCLDAASLQAPLAGIDTAYYLVHSMGGGADFEAQDRAAARNFGAAARAAGVRRIVYVGGLGGRGRRGTCAAGTRPARCCARRRCPSSSCGAASCSGPAASRSS